MAESQRVLSGSLTKGSTATLSGSVQYFYQGVNASSFTSYLGSLIPRVGSGDRTQLYRNNKKISTSIFDDTTTLNNELSDMGGENDDLFEERISFSYEKRSFGQPTEMPMVEPYADILDFDPVTYLNDNDSFMWPVNLWNIGSLSKHEFDGVIEPFDIRTEILGLDTKHLGRSIRGAVVGSFSNRPWGSIEIHDSWKVNESYGFAFLDAPLVMSRDKKEAGAHEKALNDISIQGYQNIEKPTDNGFEEKDHHEEVFITLTAHNGNDMLNALRLLNSSSCETIADPNVKRSSRGFYFGGNAGSITFGDSFMIGELK